VCRAVSAQTRISHRTQSRDERARVRHAVRRVVKQRYADAVSHYGIRAMGLKICFGQPITTQKNQPLYGGRKPHIVKFVKKVQKSKSPKVPVVKPKRYDTCTRSQWLRKGWRMPPDVMTNHPASSKHATFCQGSDMLCASSTWGVTFRRQVFFPKYSRLSKLLTRGTGKLTDRKTDIGKRPGSSAYQAAYRSSTSGFSNTSVETAMNCIRMMRFRAHNNTRTCHISGLWRAKSRG